MLEPTVYEKSRLLWRGCLALLACNLFRGRPLASTGPSRLVAYCTLKFFAVVPGGCLRILVGKLEAAQTNRNCRTHLACAFMRSAGVAHTRRDTIQRIDRPLRHRWAHDLVDQLRREKPGLCEFLFAKSCAQGPKTDVQLAQVLEIFSRSALAEQYANNQRKMSRRCHVRTKEHEGVDRGGN